MENLFEENAKAEKIARDMAASSWINMNSCTEITLSNENGVYSIRLKSVEMNVSDLFDNLIEPVLLAAGYSKAAIDDYLKG